LFQSSPFNLNKRKLNFPNTEIKRKREDNESVGDVSMNDSLGDLGVNLQLLQDENKGLNTVVKNYEREHSAMKTGFQTYIDKIMVENAEKLNKINEEHKKYCENKEVEKNEELLRIKREHEEELQKLRNENIAEQDRLCSNITEEKEKAKREKCKMEEANNKYIFEVEKNFKRERQYYHFDDKEGRGEG
jgi:hypothetical protein